MQSGFTLLEVVVTIVIITILTYMIASAFPTVREGQALLRAEQQLQSIVRSAQTRALDEQREQACLDVVGDDLVLQKKCSDIGVHIDENEVITFADTTDDDNYSNDDYEISRTTLPTGVTATSIISFLFEATPPSVSLFVNGANVDAGSHGEISLQTPQTQATYGVYPYGQFQRQ